MYWPYFTKNKVCERWKAVVETRFATIKILNMRKISEEGMKLLKRCGPSLQTLIMRWLREEKDIHWINYIAEAFPNLKSLSLEHLDIENEDFSTLSMKCRQLKSIAFKCCTFSDEGLGLLLKGLPGLQYLNICGVTTKGDLGECFNSLGDNLEHLSLYWGTKYTTAGLSHLFYKCKKVKTLELNGYFDCDKVFSKWCQESVSVQKLDIGGNRLMTKLAFSKISCLSLLEELTLCGSDGCDAVDSGTLINISRGCLNLRRVELYFLRNICDRGVKSLSGCKNMSDIVCVRCSGVSEESLVELGKCCSLKRIRLCNSWVSNSSCAAILGHCPQLEELDVSHCSGVVDGVVDVAIQAIENRTNGVVVHLEITGTCVDQEKEFRNHPLLRLHTIREWRQDYLKSLDGISF